MKKIHFNDFNSFYLKNKDRISAISDNVLSSGKYIRGENINQMEKKVANICQRKYAITTASCTDALFFAMTAAGIKEGDEVILPSFSYIASLSPILMCGAIPVFADIDSNSLMLDIEKVKNIISEKTKAVLFVQLFGSCNNLASLKNLAIENDLVIIEDAAQAIGSKYIDQPGGSFGDISCMSFDPTKIVSAFGTGGIVLTDNENYYKRIIELIHHGKSDNGDFISLGYNSKIPELNAALINLQLDVLEDTLCKLNIVASRYFKGLDNIPYLKCIFPDKQVQSSFHKFVIIAENRDELRQYLTDSGIETRIHYTPLLHEQKLLKDFSFIKHDLSISRQVKLKVLSLPIYPELSFEEIDYICSCIKAFYKL